MDNKLQISIDSAINLLDTPEDYEKYISIKISPSSGCCCSGCLRKTWQEINKAIAPYGPVGHDGDALIGDNGDKFVLEQHESGPEFIFYLSLATNLLSIVASIVVIASIFADNLSEKGKRSRFSHIKISKRQIVKGAIEEETLMELDMPISNDIQKELEEKIKKSLDNNPLL